MENFIFCAVYYGQVLSNLTHIKPMFTYTETSQSNCTVNQLTGFYMSVSVIWVKATQNQNMSFMSFSI